MIQRYVALGSSEKFAKLGNFNVTVESNTVDLYYNLDLGDHRMSMFDHYWNKFSGQNHKKGCKYEKTTMGSAYAPP